MSPMVDSAGLFDQADYSDITIKFSGQEVKCHKLILCHISEYFKKMCGPGSRFSESRQQVIELYDDGADAVMVMLRHIYGFSYISASDELKVAGLHLHMKTYIVAQKYLLPKLEQHALQSLESAIRQFSNDFRHKDVIDTTAIIEAIGILNDHGVYADRFAKLGTRLCNDHLPKLMASPEFRNMIESENEKPILDMALKAVDNGHEAALVVGKEWDVEHRILTRCNGCKKSWDAKKATCPSCARELKTKHTAVWWT